MTTPADSHFIIFYAQVAGSTYDEYELDSGLMKATTENLFDALNQLCVDMTNPERRAAVESWLLDKAGVGSVLQLPTPGHLTVTVVYLGSYAPEISVLATVTVQRQVITQVEVPAVVPFQEKPQRPSRGKRKGKKS